MEIVQPVVSVFVVIGLLLSVLFVLRKKGVANFSLPRGAAHDRQLEIIERLSLGPQNALHLVRAGDRRLLIVSTPSSCQILDSFVEGKENQ